MSVAVEARPSRGVRRGSRGSCRTRGRAAARRAGGNGQLPSADLGAANHNRLVAVLCEHAHHCVAPFAATRRTADDVTRFLTDTATAARAASRRHSRTGRPVRVDSSTAAASSDPARVVVALGDRRVELVGGEPVELRRTPGARTLTARGPLEAHLDDAGLGELVEVEGGHRPRHVERGRGVIARRPGLLSGQQRVEVAAQWLSRAAMPAMRRSRRDGSSMAAL